MGLFAGALNFVIAGAGYAIQGKLSKAIGTFLITGLLVLSGIGIPLAVVIVFYTAYDAYKNE